MDGGIASDNGHAVIIVVGVDGIFASKKIYNDFLIRNIHVIRLKETDSSAVY